MVVRDARGSGKGEASVRPRRFGAESGAAGAPAAVPRWSTAGTAPPGLLPEIWLLLAWKRLAKLLRFSVPQVPHL